LVIKSIDFCLQIFLLILKGADPYFDGFTLITFVELDAARSGRRFARAEILQIGNLFIHVNDLS